jgi:hypothetical protein
MENLWMCQHCHQEIADPRHAFFSCQLTSVASLLGYVPTMAPTLSQKAALRLELNIGINDEEKKVVHLLAKGLKCIWETRISKKQGHYLE